jgi:hypothetical protein
MGDLSMCDDPYFVEVCKTAPTQKPRRGRRILLFALIGLSAFHFFGTGSPIPLVWIERLEDPVRVVSKTKNALVLADGREVRLPFIKSLPAQDPRFDAVLARGVEVQPSGEVCGLIQERPSCGMHPYWYMLVRINLTDLIGAMDAACVDDAKVVPQEIQYLKENSPFRGTDRRMPRDISYHARRVRDHLWVAKPESEPEPESDIEPKAFVFGDDVPGPFLVRRSARYDVRALGSEPPVAIESPSPRKGAWASRSQD